MIEIVIQRQNGHIIGYEVKGHAGEIGTSIVCAGVSTLAQTTLKGLDKYNLLASYKVENGKLQGRVTEITALTDALLETMLIGYYDILGVAPNDVCIQEQEV